MAGKQVLIAALERMSPREQKWAMAAMQHYTKEWKRIAKNNNGPSVAFSVNCAIDERVKQMLATSPHAKDVKCAKGCAACCHLNVDITTQEAQLLAHWMGEQGIEIDAQRLERQAATTPATWSTLAPEDRPCVFLGEDRACKVYEHRPGACRKYVVVTDPEFCDNQLHPNHDVGILFDVEAELMHAAATKAHGIGSMAVMLSKALETKENTNGN
jgi:Fe-S-cluster containining protein